MVDEFEFPENFEEISNNTLMGLENEFKIFNNINRIQNTKIDYKNDEKNKKENNENKRQYEVFEDEEEIEEKNPKENKNDRQDNEEEKNKKEIKESKIYPDLEKKNINEKKEMESNSNNFILKNSDKIKEMISKIKFPTPEWAKNISDDQFINQIKRILNN